MHTFRKLLTCSLLATYAGISLLGHGLHLLTPEDGHHHGLGVVTCSAHHDHDHGADSDHESTDGPVVRAGSAADSHACEICEFLIHSVSEPPQVVATPDLHVLVADVPCSPQGLYSSTILGLHAARGPPQLLA